MGWGSGNANTERRTILLRSDRLATRSAPHRVIGNHVDILRQEYNRSVGHRERTAIGMMALKSAAAPRNAQRATWTVKRLLLHRWQNVEVNGQACSVNVASRREPDHIVARRNTRIVPEHN